ncbi:unnamed protein product, partial [marine sediment metagenome]
MKEKFQQYIIALESMENLFANFDLELIIEVLRDFKVIKKVSKDSNIEKILKTVNKHKEKGTFNNLDDYITKLDEVKKFFEHINEWEDTIKELYEAWSRDHLTGAYNERRYDFDIKKRERQENDDSIPLDEKKDITLMYIDIDNFKVYNDAHCHDDANFILKYIAEVSENSIKHADGTYRWQNQQNIKFKDSVYRFWGDEFGVTFIDA